MKTRVTFGLALMGTALAGLLWSGDAEAQNYPSRAITFVVPFAPGGLTDVPARLVATIMQEKIGQHWRDGTNP